MVLYMTATSSSTLSRYRKVTAPAAVSHRRMITQEQRLVCPCGSSTKLIYIQGVAGLLRKINIL